MKIIHINKRDVEKEKAMLEEGREIIRQQAEREFKSYMKWCAKQTAVEQAKQKAWH